MDTNLIINVLTNKKYELLEDKEDMCSALMSEVRKTIVYADLVEKADVPLLINLSECNPQIKNLMTTINRINVELEKIESNIHELIDMNATANVLSRK